MANQELQISKFHQNPKPDGVSPTQAASVGDCICDGWRSVAPHLAEKPGASVLVIGGQGSIPLYAVDVAAALGSTQVDYLDLDPTRLAIAEKLGARVIDSDVPDRFGEYDVIVNGSFPAEPGLACALRSLVPEGVCVSVSWQLEDPRIPLALMYRSILLKRVAELRRCHTMCQLPSTTDEQIVLRQRESLTSDRSEVRRKLRWKPRSGKLKPVPRRMHIARLQP